MCCWRVVGLAITAAMPPAAISSRIDGTNDATESRACVDELVGRVGGRVLVDGDLGRAARPVPERRHLAHLRQACVGRRQRVGQRPVRRPHVDRDRARRQHQLRPRRHFGRNTANTHQQHRHDRRARRARRVRRSRPAGRGPSGGRSARPPGSAGEVVDRDVAQRVDDRQPAHAVERAHVGDAEHAAAGRPRRTHAGGGVLDRHAVAPGRRRTASAAIRYGVGFGLP